MPEATVNVAQIVEIMHRTDTTIEHRQRGLHDCMHMVYVFCVFNIFNVQ